MKIALSDGHDRRFYGADGVYGLKEHDCAVSVNDIIEAELSHIGFDVHRINADWMISKTRFWQTWRSTLRWKTATINGIDGIDVAIETHFNVYPSHDGIGHEVLCVSQRGRYFANLVDKEFDRGLHNGPQDRGIKHRNSLWFLNETYCPAIILEPCFIDNPDDAGMIVSDKGREDIARAVVRAMMSARREIE